MPLVFIYISAGYISVSSEIFITKQHNPGDKYRLYAISVHLPQIYLVVLLNLRLLIFKHLSKVSNFGADWISVQYHLKRYW